MKKTNTNIPNDTPHRRRTEFLETLDREERKCVAYLMAFGWKLQVKRLMSSSKPPEECDLVATFQSPDKSPRMS